MSLCFFTTSISDVWDYMSQLYDWSAAGSLSIIVWGGSKRWPTLGLRWVPLQGHVFFKYFAPTLMLREKPFFDFVMDLLLLFVLSGVALAWAKRFCSRAMGMRRTTRHVPGDRIALTALWFVFPARLAAESITCGIYGMGGFLTGGLGAFMAEHLGRSDARRCSNRGRGGFYSIALGVFFVALPFSRYMHIFTEIPLIFLRRYGVAPA